jgi:hypothetical protein
VSASLDTRPIGVLVLLGFLAVGATACGDDADGASGADGELEITMAGRRTSITACSPN